MHRVFVQAREVQQGDTLCFAEPLGHFFVEGVSERPDGKITLHANNNREQFHYAPAAHVRVMLGPDRAVAGDPDAAQQAADIIRRAAIIEARDATRHKAANERAFQEQFSNTMRNPTALGLWT